MRDAATRDEVLVSVAAPAPFDDPTLGIEVAPPPQDAPPRNRLVAIGDSLTMGFQNYAAFRTDMSYPAIIAHELGAGDAFRVPEYDGPGDGLPLNLEALVRDLEARFGARIDLWEAPGALLRIRQWLEAHEDYWERGPGARFTPPPEINHNLGVSGRSFYEAVRETARGLERQINPPRDSIIDPLLPEDADARMALRALASAGGMGLTAFQAAEALGAQTGDGHDARFGIETLVVMLGSNSALGSVARLRVDWQRTTSPRRAAATVLAPSVFREDLMAAVRRVRRIRARLVVWATVPHVTIAPIARGVDEKVRDGSRYFEHYTYPWIAGARFNRAWDPHITHRQARAVDAAIDQYNDDIARAVAAARRAGRDWRILDIAGLLDRLAHRRYLQDRSAQPPWWTPYPLPPELAALRPVPDSQFLSTDDAGRRDAGGLISLDGVHPTTIGYGILAQEVIDVMGGAGVRFQRPDGTPRPWPVRVDMGRVLAEDTLMQHPPRSADSSLRTIGWVHRNLPFVRDLVS
jgi:hypothetical protein